MDLQGCEILILIPCHLFLIMHITQVTQEVSYTRVFTIELCIFGTLLNLTLGIQLT